MAETKSRQPVTEATSLTPLFKVFEEEGERIETGGNHPFLIHDPDSVWLVKTGKIDIFAIHLENGEATGRRHHLLRIEAGHLMLGVDSVMSHIIGVLAVGFSDTVLFKLPLLRLRTCAREIPTLPAVMTLLDVWIERLSASVVGDITPKDYKILEAEQETELPTDIDAGSLTGVLWVQHRKGRSLFLSKMPLETDGFFPISGHTWLHTSEDTTLYAVTTASFLKHDPDWSSIHTFHNCIGACLHHDLKHTELQERQRLDEQAHEDREIFSTAVTRLATVLDQSGTTIQITPGDHTALLTACRWVCESLGIEIANPPSVTSGLLTSGTLEDITRASKIRVRQVMLRGEWWRNDHGPLLSYIEENSKPVALLPISAKRYEIAYPEEGRREVVTPELAESLTPFAYTFYRALPERILTGIDLFILGARGCRRDLLMVLLMGVAAGLLGLVTPVATGHLFDTIIPESERPQLYQLTGVLIISAFSVALFNIVRAISILRIEGKMNMSIQAAVWDRLLNLPTSFFRRYTSGDLAMRAMGINQIREIISGVVVSTLLSSLFSVFHFGLLFYYDWQLALLAIGLAVLFIGIVLLISYYRLHYEQQLAELEGTVSGMVLQFISGMAKLRLSGAEKRAFAAWTRTFSEKKRVAFKAGTVQNYLEVAIAIFPVLSSIVIFALALNLIEIAQTAGIPSFTTGGFLAFSAAFTLFLTAVLEMGMTVITALSIVPLYHRARPILETLPEVSTARSHPGKLKGEVELNQVSFSYSEDGPVILKDVSLSIGSGDYVAIVGPSGSGKSTLLRLLLGFEQTTAGSIYYDGRNMVDLDIGEVRRQCGVVLQNGKLRSGTLFENIIGSSGLSLDNAWEAARMAGLEADIEQMPMGMHTIIDTEGTTLSGGQKQRLMIARAIVKKPRLLFFDEATSALDNQAQSTVNYSLERLLATRIVIAHRLSTIIHADCIHVMENGVIVQNGTYDELMSQPGLFADLTRRQIA